LSKNGDSSTRFPSLDTELDEYPAVPFLSEDNKHFQYDSTSIAHWLDAKKTPNCRALFPHAPTINFVAKLIDEAFDEFGLYTVHHMRWVGSAKSNCAGKTLAREFRHALPPGGGWYLAHHFPKRQVRRCPYLFSVAPKNYRSGMNKALHPPSREGFPETHSLLNESWKQYLKGMESVLAHQAYLLGDTFTIADASAYGQLAMNLADPEAANKMKSIAPLTYKWLNKIYNREHVLEQTTTEPKLYLSDHLKPLLRTIMSTFSSLMVQNHEAYKLAKQLGETVFNETAFNEGRALYDGQLRGYPFRSVVKTFQVRVWKALCQDWAILSSEDKGQISEIVELCELFKTNSD